MPRGQSASNSKWNFHVSRYMCPVCKRKGIVKIWYKGTGMMFTCMYRSGYKKDCKSQFLFNLNDPEILKYNSNL